MEKMRTDFDMFGIAACGMFESSEIMEAMLQLQLLKMCKHLMRTNCWRRDKLCVECFELCYWTLF